MRTIHRLICTTIFVAIATLCAGCPSRAARQQLSTAQAALEQKRYDEAMAAAERYLKQDPKGIAAAEALYFKGRALEQRVKKDDAAFARDLSAAKSHYIQALQLKPARELESYVQTSLGNVTFWLYDYSAAKAAFQRAHELLPAGDLKGWALYRLALSQQRLGHWTDADKSFAEVQREFPGTEIAKRSKEHQGARAFYVQVGSFQSIGNADKLVAQLRGQGVAARRVPKPDRDLHAVMAGPARTYDDAMTIRTRLSSQFRDAVIVP